ncbi:unnamed protein product [Ranitomeya imitator]|uniref:GPN-loop GTPase 3 n=1 Tax=Ranitomeya imitator TaxID=111125 RepID=A0ABN9KTV6_9NEOB|nr:unnamed protein product [Ranitomeya imitator]
MPRYAQLVMGPAGSGKSTYCSTMVQHCEALNRSVQVVNLDPAAEYFDYPVMAGTLFQKKRGSSKQKTRTGLDSTFLSRLIGGHRYFSSG